MVNSTKPQKVIKDHSFSKETLSFLRQKVLKLENKVTDLQQTHPFPIAIHKGRLYIYIYIYICIYICIFIF